MNPQPEFSESITYVIAWLFIVYLFYSNKDNHYKFSDEFTLATVKDSPEVIIQPSQVQPPPVPKPKTKKTKNKKKSKTKAKPQSNIKAARKPSHKPIASSSRNKNGYTELQQDCFEALKSLGMKTVRERKFIVSTVFNDHNPNTVQDFLKLALSRSC